MPELSQFWFQIMIEYPSLTCFGCHLHFQPGAPLPGGYPVTMTLELVSGFKELDHRGPHYRPTGIASDLALLGIADASGWRKVAIYGQTIYVCPNCRKLRTQPEWERHLVEQCTCGPKLDPNCLVHVEPRPQ